MTESQERPRVALGEVRWMWTALVVLCILVPLLVWQDRVSLERGNRLYRAGDPEAAAQVYRESQNGRDRIPTAGYNLGTALLETDPDSAEDYLWRATRGQDGSAAQRGFYNLGYRFLTSAREAMVPDSTILSLSDAVTNNRAALRLDPTDQSARWNLALAQRRLDALVPPDEQAEEESGGNGSEELVIDDQSLTRSESADAISGLEPEDPRQADNTGERQGSQEGAREAWANQDPGPISLGDAMALLGGVIDSPESLIRGILWSHRPDIAWWESQPYPGGEW